MTKCIDQLTFGEIKELMALFGNQTPQSGNIANPVIGKYCIARCYSAGVHAGTVVSVDGENVVLENSSRLWKWKAKEGVALSGLAQNGLEKTDVKIDTENPVIYLTGVCELIPCADGVKETINGK